MVSYQYATLILSIVLNHLQLVSPISNTHQTLNVYLVEQYAKLRLIYLEFFLHLSITSCSHEKNIELSYFRTASNKQLVELV